MRPIGILFQIQLLCAVVAALLCFAISDAKAVDGIPIWTNLFNGTANNFDQAYFLAKDTNGNVYVAGYSTSTGGIVGYATIKYSGTGMALWTNTFNGPGNVYYAQGLKVSSSGDVYVTGSSIDITSDYATIKYSSAGVPMWTNYFNGPESGSDFASALALDGNEDVYVTGTTYDNVGNSTFATVKYSSSGVPSWTNFFAEGGYNNPNGIVVDGNANVYVAGQSSQHFMTIKYSSDGEALWTNRGPGSAAAVAAIALDAVGDVYVTGITYQFGDGDFATIKYTSEGSPVWTNFFGRPGNESESPRAMAVDREGNIYVTGCTHCESSDSDFATVKYAPTGTPMWTNLFNGVASLQDQANALAVDASGNVYVTGYSRTSDGGSDYATIKYSSGGVTLWTNLFNGQGNLGDEAAAILVDDSGDLYVTGSSHDANGLWDFATIKYSRAAALPLSINTSDGRLGFTNGLFGFTLSGTAGQTVAIESSTNLQHWVRLQTNLLGSSQLYFSDPQSTNAASRFYRAVVLQ